MISNLEHALAASFDAIVDNRTAAGATTEHAEDVALDAIIRAVALFVQRRAMVEDFDRAARTFESAIGCQSGDVAQ